MAKLKPDAILRRKYRMKRCLVCGDRGCDPAHIKTWGSTGIDADWMFMPLCRLHHTEQHTIGIKTFINKYYAVEKHLLKMEWEISGIEGSLEISHPKLRAKLKEIQSG